MSDRLVGSDFVSDTTHAPVVEGWFAADPEPHLIGAQCPGCGTYVFPPRATDCPNPACESAVLEPVALSRRGTLWSYAENRYAPPLPYVAAEPFEPYALAAVELEAEGIIVLGQVADGVTAAELKVGMPMQLEIGNLNDGPTIYVWAPATPSTDDKEVSQ